MRGRSVLLQEWFCRCGNELWLLLGNLGCELNCTWCKVSVAVSSSVFFKGCYGYHNMVPNYLKTLFQTIIDILG